MQFKTPLRPLLFVCALSLFFSSCQKDGPSEQKNLIDIETRDAAWTKLSIPGLELQLKSGDFLCC